MTASDVLARLARYGLWRDPRDPDARAWIDLQATARRKPFDAVAQELAQDPRRFRAAIRRQWFANVLWYSRPIDEVLGRCAAASPGTTLLDALNLHEDQSVPTVPVPLPGERPERPGVVLDGISAVGVSVDQGQKGKKPGFVRKAINLGVDYATERWTLGNIGRVDLPGTAPPDDEETTGQIAVPAMPSTETRVWPRLDAPEYTPAQKPFNVVAGFAVRQQAHVAGGPIVLPKPTTAVPAIDMTVELIVEGVAAPDGCVRTLRVDLASPSNATVSFRLVGLEPDGPEPVRLTTIEIRYVHGGSVCGTASRPLVIGRSNEPSLALPAPGFGTPWLSQPAAATPIAVQQSPSAPDLTIEILKPDGNAAFGSYMCQLRSPYPLVTPVGPFRVDLGQDAKTFARSVVDNVRQYAASPLVDNMIASFGDLAATKLPPEVMDALREVAACVAPDPPSVLLVSAEPYVPWELALINPPLDPSRPPYLGAQVVLGRWLSDRTANAPAPSASRIEKPPPAPPAAIGVDHMAVMVGLYKPASGLAALPAATEEGNTLTTAYRAVRLDATSTALKQLLDATVDFGGQTGGPDAVHFAGHGEFDASRPDASVLLLNDATPIQSQLFRTARYGDGYTPRHQPICFLNACMIGIGNEMLGDMGGFPGNLLRGGFGAMIGALWEVNDAVGRDVAIEFWRRAMPAAPGATGEPVGVILRDLRSKYGVSPTGVPVATYLSYVFYGHPRLTLTR